MLPLLLMLITAGCVTRTECELSLPPKPERQEIAPPESARDYARIIVYYEYLVREWEAWGDTVSDMVGEE